MGLERTNMADFQQIDAWLAAGSTVAFGAYLITGFVGDKYIAKDRFQVDCYIDKEGKVYYARSVIDAHTKSMRTLPN